MLAMLCIWFHVEAARIFWEFFFYGLQKTEVTVLLFFCVLVLHVHFFYHL